MVPYIRKNQLILDISLDVCILFLDVAIVDHLLCIYYIHCLPAVPDALLCFVSEWRPCTCINVLASNHIIKLVNTDTRTCHSILDRLTIGNKCRSLNWRQTHLNARSKIMYKKYMPGLLFRQTRYVSSFYVQISIHIHMLL